MKIQLATPLATLAAALAFSGAAFADSHSDIQELFAMSNNSAAEILVRETSMGDLTAAQVALALGNMSAAERMGFLESDMSTRLEVIAAQMKLLNGDSAAEGN